MHRVEVLNHDDRVSGEVKPVIRVVAGVMPTIRKNVVRLMCVVDLRQETLIAETTGREVSVTATEMGAMRPGSRVRQPGSSVVEALAVRWDPRSVWLRALAVASLAVA